MSALSVDVRAMRDTRTPRTVVGQEVGGGALTAIATVASVAGTGLGAYHGYMRHRGSVGWAVIWGLLGGIVPIFTIPISLAQGFGKPGK